MTGVKTKKIVLYGLLVSNNLNSVWCLCLWQWCWCTFSSCKKMQQRGRPQNSVGNCPSVLEWLQRFRRKKSKKGTNLEGFRKKKHPSPPTKKTVIRFITMFLSYMCFFAIFYTWDYISFTMVVCCCTNKQKKKKKWFEFKLIYYF